MKTKTTTENGIEYLVCDMKPRAQGKSATTMSLKDEDVKVGDHCWALCEGQLLVVMKEAKRPHWPRSLYAVCGPWEFSMSVDDLELLEIIPRPKSYETTELYYLHE